MGDSSNCRERGGSILRPFSHSCSLSRDAAWEFLPPAVCCRPLPYQRHHTHTRSYPVQREREKRLLQNPASFDSVCCLFYYYDNKPPFQYYLLYPVKADNMHIDIIVFCACLLIQISHLPHCSPQRQWNINGMCCLIGFGELGWVVLSFNGTARHLYGVWGNLPDFSFEHITWGNSLMKQLKDDHITWHCYSALSMDYVASAPPWVAMYIFSLMWRKMDT